MESRKSLIKEEDCELESRHATQTAGHIKQEDCERGPVTVKENSFEWGNVAIKTEPPEQVCINFQMESNAILDTFREDASSESDATFSARLTVKQEMADGGCSEIREGSAQLFSVQVKSEMLKSDGIITEDTYSIRDKREQPVFASSHENSSGSLSSQTLASHRLGNINKEKCASEMRNLASWQHNKICSSIDSIEKLKSTLMGFQNRSSLCGLMRTETGEKPYCCSECGKRFSQMSNLHTHKRIHTGEKPHCCSECGKQFSRSTSLKTHLRIHTGEKPHSCSECGKQFSQVSSLQTHRRIHTGEKPHCCLDCGKQFSCISNLQSHRRIHTGEKSHCCSECGRLFSEISNLQVHMRIHTGEKPHSCSECGKRFSKINNLKRHKIIHTGEKPYSCSDCNKHFSRRNNLQIHMKIHT
ncbi:zinc finger and SCAN domain-containing protein 2-like [Erpetoichthys calabaricus]|uniref:Zinc finger and SCAN domain-containing protein 2-like n=1 Tax=Erpetoichthys calabaricus TaxID=27687 RepID=A0A8C4XFJ8_ERPCA|nr:zinc finger and SCAN domain-containing protein 2-like [Erpetoichthys calabaricus]